MRKKPYIGVTGFVDQREVNRAVDLFPVRGDTIDRLLMVGVLVSSKTLAGKTNKYPVRYPAVGSVVLVFPDTTAPTLNLIHFSSDNPRTLMRDLDTLVALGGSSLHGFQLNIAWPSVRDIKMFRAAFPALRLVLQIGGAALAAVEHSPTRLCIRLSPYEGLIDDVLIDASGGRGISFAESEVRPYIQVLTEKTRFGLGVAGGLCHKTVGKLASLLRDYPQLSLDAESCLRNQDDTLNEEYMLGYLRHARALCRAAEWHDGPKFVTNTAVLAD